MAEIYSFGAWVRRRRKALDLTHDALARRVGCALSMIRKIEADERRPSRQIAELLATQLQIPAAEREAFLQAARGERPSDQLELPTIPAVAASSPNTPHIRENLPIRLTSFIGREREVADLIAVLGCPDARLVTLTGPGGTGKTILALTVAGQLAHACPDGVWFVDLAPLTSAYSVIGQQDPESRWRRPLCAVAC